MRFPLRLHVFPCVSYISLYFHQSLYRTSQVPIILLSFLSYIIYIHKKHDNIIMNRNKIRLTESQLHSIVKESVKRVISEMNLNAPNKGKRFFVADEGGYANAFSVDMFDNEGWLEGHENEEGYNIEDFDIIRYCNTWQEACRVADKING